ncbi:MAG: TonB-dependent receptor, partial [Flavobacteriaceae bacterium]|nr:TonB-dependent receptor [Flavobacteriaceae bacterium]
SLYHANLNSFNNGNATYVLYEDRNDDKQLWFNSIFESRITANIIINASLQYRKLKSKNYAKVIDLLGGSGYLDVDTFSDGNDRQQSDLLQPNRIVGIGDEFKYNYNLNARIINGFVQTQFSYHKIDFYTSASFSTSSYQRNGLFQNGKFPEENQSLGKSKKMTFKNFGFKGGFTYKITGRHLIDIHAGIVSKAPTMQNTFSNSRVNNDIVKGLKNEKTFTSSASYILRTPSVKGKITGYFTKIKDATNVSFYYADGLGGSGSGFTAFVQEIVTGINKKQFGIELGVETQLTSSFKLKGAANIGQYTYDNNPILSLTSEIEDFEFSPRPSNLKNYKLAAGPQHAYSIGFEYRSPNYWWIGATANFFENIYISIAPLTRTNNFSDDGGIPFNDYDPFLAKQLLKQEKFDNYMVVNAVGGKSWKIDNYYVSAFASVSNLLNVNYKTGGVEQGRNANFRELRDDKALDKPIFGAKYWYGRGTTYFLNLNVRF